MLEPGSQSAASYSYDYNGNLKNFTDPNGNSASFTYNEINKVLTASQLDRETAYYKYDGEGRIKESWEGISSEHNIYFYNPEGSLNHISFADTQTVDYGYGERGLQRYSSRTDLGGGTVGIESAYNINGLLSSRIQKIDGTPRSMQFLYSAMGQLRYIDYPQELTGDSFQVEYQYTSDAFHRLKNVPGYVDNIVYDNNSRAVRMDFANGMYEITQRDELGRPLYMGLAEALEGTITKYVEHYTWNARGNLAEKTREEYNTKKMTLLGSITETYGYDSNDRLTSLLDDGGFQLDYGYDSAGNRLTDPYDTAQLPDYYEYDSVNRLIRQGFTNENHLVFDWIESDGRKRGNMVEKNLVDSSGQPISTQATYNWTEDNLLLQVDRPSVANVSYRYSAGGNRALKTSGGNTTRYLFLGINVQYEEMSDGQVNYYIYALGRHIAKTEGVPGRRNYSYDTFNYHTDYLSSVWAATDDRGKIVWTERYRPFGSEAEQSGSIENDYRFTGKAWDAEAGLFYFNARWYDSDIGRFISEDPLWGNILDPQSLNRFRYARNNPFRFNDPTGLYDDQDNYDDTELFGNAPDSPTRSEDGEGMGLDFPELLGPARDAEHGNPIPFIEALKEILEKYLGKRNPADKYSFLPIARNWKDIPESVRNYKTGDKIQDTISGLGLHKDNKRFAGGYHIATEKNIQGVWMHYDAYDPMRSTTDFILHNTVEVYKTFLLPETYYP